MAEGSKRAKLRAGRSLNLLLWFSFSVFALVLLLFFMTVQSFLVGRNYRDRTVDLMREAATELIGFLGTSSDSTSLEVLRRMKELEEEYDVRFHLLYPDGRNVYSDLGDDPTYHEVADSLKEHLSAGGTEVVVTSGSTIGYATAVGLEGEDYFLYTTVSLLRIDYLENDLRWLSLATALFSVVLAFVASGFMAMLITKPVTEVTDRAKELARGRYDLNIRHDYFCSEISELADALDYARSEISKTDAMQRELIANVSHDFKTPLTMIKAYASMIREISGDNKQKRDTHAQIIIDETDRLTALVNDLLDLSKLRAGVGNRPSEDFDLTELVRGVVSRFDYLKETQGYNIELDAEPDARAFADRDRIEQVVYNLIGNAVNYTGEDKTVRIRLKRTSGGVLFEVEDTGPGIPPDRLDTIWDRYYRGEETHRRPVQGTGLGLSIVKSILLAHDCPFGVRSEEGKGSTFWVEFPTPAVKNETEAEERPKRR